MCLQAHGEFSVLTGTIYHGIAIMYEDRDNYSKAFDYFIKAQNIKEEVFISL